ncbi:MAG: hypothetical protein ACHQYP_07210 [Nitrospiria bacterium]
MFQSNIKTRLFSLFLLILSGCGLGAPTNGHDPYKPLPVLISDNAQVLVDHTTGAIITTPDGKASLSVAQTALNADTSFEIVPYGVVPSGVSIDQMYSLTPVSVTTLEPQEYLIVTLKYDPTLIPKGTPETDLRLGVLDPNRNCWDQVFLDSPPVLPGHSVSSRQVTHLGIFGVTTFFALICQ